ncbi:Protein of unknown function (DUF4197) [Mariprofundus aestuarium]|uniref:DUF4197 domain-containing protein n=1 Tax=Mariprofundus aestuarium TaxID=1921086 RepID=A0A2K8KWE4_MARES|nr:DUF4197 domain-containing protein [Mariprofundus aestuarium]ATX79210.1 Protein of unknown function (DUF4197) [Mariprofundus aestuarium]
MTPLRMLQSGLFATTLLFATTATAGWMDQLGGILGEVNNSTQDSDATTAIANPLTNTDMVAGLKDALRVGSEQVVGQLSRTDGFNGDPKIHIPLPENMQTVKSALNAVGMGYMMEDLELKLNRAAELATPKAKRIFGDSIKAMTITDAKNILNGPNDAATQYFKGKMSSPLSDEMRPIVQQALNEAGAVQAYDSVMGEYATMPFVPDVKANLTQHVLDLGLQGIFHYMAVEEAAIRKNPAKRTTEILQKVFSR